MMLSEHARSLLSRGQIDELQALSYYQLLSDDARQEIVEVFKQRAPDLHESTGPVVHDPILLSTLSDACVVSSGQVYSKEVIDELFRAAGNRHVRCPLAREVLIKNIAGPGQHYVLLPKLDEAIRIIRELRASFMRRFAERRQTSEASTFGLPFFGRREPQYPARNPEEPYGKIWIQAAKGRVNFIMRTNRFPEIFIELVRDYFQSELPQGRVNNHGRSYTFSSFCFGRCWKESHNAFSLNLWFPVAENLPPHRSTFNDCYLLQLLVAIQNILDAQDFFQERHDAVSLQSIATLERGKYVTALEQDAVTFPQMLLCAKTFLDETKKIAAELRFDINDTVESAGTSAQRSQIVGQGDFGSAHDARSVTSASSFR